MLPLLAIALTAALQQGAPGQTPNTLTLAKGAPLPPAKIADVAWLAGHWEGEFMGGTIDEVWSAPDGGTMVGHFRFLKDGKPVFYEIMTLLERAGGVEMRLKHLNPDMTGWEEKDGFVTFALIKHGPEGLYFDGLTLRRSSPDTIEGYIAIEDRKAGTVREEKLAYRRVK